MSGPHAYAWRLEQIARLLDAEVDGKVDPLVFSKLRALANMRITRRAVRRILNDDARPSETTTA